MQKDTLTHATLLRTGHSFAFRDLNKNGTLDVYEDPRQLVEARVDDLLRQMTICCGK